MKMWMVDPIILCRKHLMGEHGELHKHLHCWVKRFKVDGRIAGNAMEPLSYKERHDVLAEEIKRRGWNHKSPLEQPDFSYLKSEYLEYKIDIESALEDLLGRCSECKERYEKYIIKNNEHRY